MGQHPLWPPQSRPRASPVAESPVGQPASKKRPRMGAARGLCTGHRPERSTGLDSYAWDLLAPAGSADLPPSAREAAQHWRGDAAKSLRMAPVAGSGGAVARCAASGRRGGFAQSCSWWWTFDRGRSDLRCRHQQGSCGRFARASSIDRAESGLAHFRNFSFPFWIEGIDVNSHCNLRSSYIPDFAAATLPLAGFLQAS
eukprot:COSAG06_NODE_4020_length_4654_cov_2.838419_3_plen_199_part_00